MALRIRYRDASDEVTERIISEVIVVPPNAIHAFCQLRQEERTFVLSRIEQAVETATGELIEDVWLHFGLPSLKRPPLTLPRFTERPVRLTEAQAKSQRNEDKRNLWSRFQLEGVIAVKRGQLNALFAGRCFKCSQAARLVFDHHVPQCLGGRLVPGNLVLLCGHCNKAKHDRPPREFYSQAELDRLTALLEQQLELFDFEFNWTAWGSHPKAYLMSLGVSEAQAEQAVRTREEALLVRLTVPGMEEIVPELERSEGALARGRDPE